MYIYFFLINACFFIHQKKYIYIYIYFFPFFDRLIHTDCWYITKQSLVLIWTNFGLAIIETELDLHSKLAELFKPALCGFD